MYYFQSEKDRLARKRIRDASKGVGKPKIGGPFDLVDQDGKPFTSEDLKGKFALVGYLKRRVARHIMLNGKTDLLRLLTLPRHLP